MLGGKDSPKWIRKFGNSINHEFRIFSKDGSANPIARSRASRERRGGEKKGTGSKGSQTQVNPPEVARPALGNISSGRRQGDKKPVRGGYDSDVGEERGKDKGLEVQPVDPGDEANTAGRWHLLKIDNYGMKKAKKSGHDYFNLEVVI